MGYYKERIKGSNLERMRSRVSWGVVGISAIIGVLLFFSPGVRRIKELDEAGWFEDPEWRKEKKQLFRDQMQHMALPRQMKREEYEQQKQDKVDSSFPQGVLKKPASAIIAETGDKTMH